MRGRDGFTLVEALVALLIVGAALVPLLGALTAGLRAQGRVAAALEGVALAEARMAELALLPVDSLAAYHAPRTGAFPPPLAGHRWSAVVRGDTASPALVRGAVLVEWPGGSYSLETVFHRPELLPASTRGR